MSEGLTVVLGWDGLDHELATAFGLADAFGRHHRRIETFDNEKVGSPHTSELWPSIITGLRPEEHGLGPRVEEGRAEWRNPTIDLASRLANGVVPKSVRTRIGAVLLERGQELDYQTSSYFAENDLETLFDGRRGRPVAIPNYRTDADQELDVVFRRSNTINDFLHNERDEAGETVHRPRVSLHRLEERLVSEMYRKVGVVRACVQRAYDLVFVWFGYLDTVGHLAPVVEEGGWQERAYELAAAATAEIRASLADEDVLVSVSDHGLQDGKHTHETFLGASDPAVLDGTDSVLDVRAGIERVTGRRDPVGADEAPPVRERYRKDSEGGRAGPDDVRSNLEDLGYL